MRRSVQTTAILVPILALLSACETSAQRSAAAMVQRRDAALERANACTRNADNTPERAFVASRLPIQNDSPINLTQLANDERPTPAEIAMLNIWFETGVSCRQHYLDAARAVSSVHEAILHDVYAQRDNVYAALARREISWSTASERLRQIRSQGDFRTAQADRDLNANLEAQHQHELSRRAAAAAAFSAAMAQASQNLQQQQMQQQLMLEMNRPRTTNCYRFGGSINCTTY